MRGPGPADLGRRWRPRCSGPGPQPSLLRGCAANPSVHRRRSTGCCPGDRRGLLHRLRSLAGRCSWDRWDSSGCRRNRRNYLGDRRGLLHRFRSLAGRCSWGRLDSSGCRPYSWGCQDPSSRPYSLGCRGIVVTTDPSGRGGQPRRTVRRIGPLLPEGPRRSSAVRSPCEHGWNSSSNVSGDGTRALS